MPNPNAADKYIAVATKRFAQTGFHGSSLAMIAKDAGVSKQALLHFFGTKESLYAAVLTGLCDRLIADIDSTPGATARDRLTAYFSAQCTGLVSETTDAHLAVRALLDSDPHARSWPLKPYLDRLVALWFEAAGASDRDHAFALAQVYQLIGMIQYFAVSQPILRGMYGEYTVTDMRAAFEAAIARSVASMPG